MSFDLKRLIDATSFVGEPYRNKSDANGQSASANVSVTETSSIKETVDVPDLSIIVTCFNKRPYLKECIESVARQDTGYKIEVLVFDNASTDGSLEEAFRLQREYPSLVRVFASDGNVGLVHNLLRALPYCRGRYGSNLDSDDYIFGRDKYEKQISFMDSHPEVVMTYTNAMVQYETSHLCRTPLSCRTVKRLKGMNKLLPHEFAAALLQKNFITASSPVFRLDAMMKAREKMLKVFDMVGWFPTPDFPSWFLVAAQGKVQFLPVMGNVYRVNSGSVTHTSVLLNAAREVADQRIRMALLMLEPSFVNESMLNWVVEQFLCKVAWWLCLSEQMEKCPQDIREAAQRLGNELPYAVKAALVANEWNPMCAEVKRCSGCRTTGASPWHYLMKRLLITLFRL